MPGAVSIDPSDEACQALVAHINSATSYTLPRPAAYTHAMIDDLQEVSGFRVDVAHLSCQQMQDTMELEDRSRHLIRVWCRDKLPDTKPDTVASRNLLMRKIFQRVENFTSADRRVVVWECGKQRGDIPGQAILVEALCYRSYVELEATVEPP